MPITTVSSREFNQAASDVKRAANSGPVFITDRGRPAHVLMSIDHYRSLTQEKPKIVDLLAMPDSDFEFDTTRSPDLARAADLS